MEKEPHITQQTLIREEVQMSMEMEMEVERTTLREDKEGRDNKEQDNRKAREEDAIETEQAQATRPDARATDMEDMELRKEGREQQDFQVRSGVTPVTTSDDDMTTHKPMLGAKRTKKQKVTKENGQARDKRGTWND
jgi:hypothetical protein